MELQQQLNQDKYEKSFNLVFHNKIILKLIIGYAKLYENNKFKSFFKREELLEYTEKEYISKLSYSGVSILEKGDLPVDGVLEEISFDSIGSIINGNAIPYGVKKIHFYSNENSVTEIKLSTLPSSIECLWGISILNEATVEKADGSETEEINYYYALPSNIRTIRFNKCPNISGVNNGSGFITIPNSIETLVFSYTWNNQGVELRVGDIPPSVTSLFVRSLVTNNINVGVLPNSIKDLTISCDDKSLPNGPFETLPTNIETLVLHSKVSVIYPTCQFNSFTSITKLSINFDYTLRSMEIKPNSLPPNLTDLSLIGFDGYIEKEAIPNCVAKLNTSFSFRSKDNGFIEKGAIPNSVLALSLNLIITEKDILPNSLVRLSMQGSFRSFIDPNTPVVLDQMISILPQTLTSITLSKQLEKHNKVFPTYINVSYN